ncbi:MULTISPECIES: ammonium transporter [Methylococcus]|uniref:Ammonium transporter n=1 Tax=Methylococcus capsulatus TaxID=414 RepID=A0ABZ2F7R1_METCP|nr:MULTISPECIES: ammonium transporter [Methylococcus]MDF9391064.1 ammonium transporter [Methylococcus capsulatus]
MGQGPKFRGFSLLGCLLVALPLKADEFDAADTAWILTSTGFAWFMTVPGLALLYAGLVRTKNVLSVLAQCFAVAALVSLVWMGAGYSLALGRGGCSAPWLGGTSRLFLHGLTADSAIGHVSEAAYCIYHLGFAVLAPTLMVGGFAERMKFSAVLWFTTLWMLLVYAPVCHWLWGGGWLARLGAADFSGGVVVHATAGASALTAAWLVGPRRGFPDALMPPHNLTLTAAGAGMLWIGWHGFSAGSALITNGAAGLSMLNTHLAASAGAMAWMGVEWVRFGRPTLLGLVTGMIAGLVALSPAAGYVGPQGAVIVGGAGGLACFFAIPWIRRKLEIDDAMDVFPVHAAGALLGVLLTPLVAGGAWGGSGFPGDLGLGQRIGVQLVAIAAAGVWSGTVSYLILKGLDRWPRLRVSPDEETEGLDLSSHNGKGYYF